MGAGGDVTRKLRIEFREAEAPIREPVTKFGGQPVWVAEPQWPVSRRAGKAMQFIAQIAIDPALFPQTRARMAYLFMTDVSVHQDVDGTFEADGGENTVILQPGRCDVPVWAMEMGPSLYRMVTDYGAMRRRPVLCEYAVRLTPGEDPTPEELAQSEAREELGGNKIGGVPDFIQAEEYPGPGAWSLLLQLDSGQVPFEVNFGDAGVGYAFLSGDGKRAKFLWQCF